MRNLPSSNEQVSAQFLFRTYLSCHALHARKPVLLSALKLTEPELRDPRRWFNHHDIGKMIRVTQQELGRDDIQEDIARNMVPAGFSDAGYSAFFEHELGEVLESTLMAQGLGGLNPPYRFQRSIRGDRLFLNRDNLKSPNLIHLLFSLICQSALPWETERLNWVRAAHFGHSRPVGFQGLMRGKSIPCHFERPATYLEFLPGAFSITNPLQNSDLQIATRRQNRFLYDHSPGLQPLANLIYTYLLRLLDKRGLSLDAAARTLGIAERTLRRKLVAEGLSFRSILERVRRDTCKLYFLEGRRSLAEISTKLGYSELSAFTRAYSSWYGYPPSRGRTAAIAA